jgi:hypothetical protein
MAQRRGKQREFAESHDDADSRPPKSDDPGESAGPIPEMMRRALTLGLAGFFTTEGAVRKALEDTVPKDWTDFLAETSERTRSEFLERLSGEIGRVLEGMDFAAVLQQLMLGRTLEVKAEFRLSDDREEGETGSPQIRFSSPSSTGNKTAAATPDAEAQGED